MNGFSLPPDFKPAHRTQISDESRPLSQHIMKTGAASMDAVRVAVVFTNTYGDEGRRVFDLFHAHGWTASDIRDLLVLGHQMWRRHPDWLLAAECVLIQRLGLDPRTARMCVIKNRAYSDMDPERLAAGIETFKALPTIDPRDLTWIAEHRARAFYCKPIHIEGWYALHRNIEQHLAHLHQLMQVAPRVFEAEPAVKKPRLRKLQAKTAVPAPAAIAPAPTTVVPAAVANRPEPKPEPPKQIVKKIYDLFPAPPPRKETADDRLPTFSPKELERVIRQSFAFEGADAYQKQLSAPFYGEKPQALQTRLQELMSLRKKGPMAHAQSLNWNRFWRANQSDFLDHGRNILDLSKFFETAFSNGSVFLFHRLIRFEGLFRKQLKKRWYVFSTSWNVTAMRLAVLRRYVGADVLAHPELLLWPFETIDEAALRGRVHAIQGRGVKAKHRPFIDLLFAPSNESFKNDLDTALRVLSSR